MKKIPNILLGAILLGVILLHTTCSDKKAFAKITLEGYVYDSLGGKPVIGKWVVLRACQAGEQDDECAGYTVGQAQTDVSGRFYIHDDAARSNRYMLDVEGTSAVIGDMSNGCTATWMKKYCAMIYLKDF